MKRYHHLATLGIGLGLACAGAQAQVKDPLPDSLSLGGVTLYGTVDVGYAYQSKGVPLNSQYVGGLEYQAFTTTRNFSGSQSTLAESGLEQSKIGITVKEPISGDISLVARAETGFNPLSGQLTDACATLVTNSQKAQGNQTANADSSRCGQAFNSVLYGGASSPTYGTLTIGRHNSLQLDALVGYDPQALSYAFSFLGYSGFNAGAGSTQAARWDNSFKYAYANGPFRITGMYSKGGNDTGILGNAVAADAGVTFGGLSVDAIYEYAHGAVNLRSSFDDTPAALGAPYPEPEPGLNAYLSDDTSYNIEGKYVFDLGEGKLKDKLTLYAGYSHIEKAHTNYIGSGYQAQGSYNIDVTINVNNSAVYNMEWIGARYALTSGWNFTAAAYHINQNSWTIGLGGAGTQDIGCALAGLLCSGNFYEGSFAVDYVINKHYDAYIGVNYSEVTDGLASGFVGTPGADATSGSETQVTGMVGFRVKF